MDKGFPSLSNGAKTKLVFSAVIFVHSNTLIATAETYVNVVFIQDVKYCCISESD